MKQETNVLWSALTDDERRIAEENLDRYLELAWEICEAMHAGEHRLDEVHSRSTMEERSNT